MRRRLDARAGATTGGPFIVNGMLVQGMTGCGNATAGRLLHHRARREDRRGEVARQHHRASGRPELQHLERHPAGEPLSAARPGFPAATIPSRTWSSTASASPIRGSRKCNGLLPKKPGAKNNALYTDSTLAIEPKTGKVKWYHQHLENDTWDLDYVYERMLIDLPVNGATRKTLVTTGKLGIIEAIDRTNGEWLWHKETIPQNVVDHHRSQDRREDDQSGGDPAYRPDHGELPCRSRRPRLAGDGLQPEHPDACSCR